MKEFVKITDPIDGIARWYWGWAGRAARDIKWHGPFRSEADAKEHADGY